MTDKPTIEAVTLADIQPDAHNANRGTERGTFMIRRSLEKLGAGRSILLDSKGRIIAGNKTAEAAGDIGLDDVLIVRTRGDKLVAVLREDLDLDDPAGQARELAYADNRAGQVSLDFDPAVIQLDLAAGVDLSDWWQPFELEAFGVEPDEPQDAEPQIDRAEELRVKWQVEPGQLWRLPSRTAGQEHRLICGDCTDAAVVERVGIEAHMPLFTDPPYGINHDPAWLDGVGTHRQALSSRDVIANDDGSLDLSFLTQHPRRMVWGFPYLYDPDATGWIVWDKQPGLEGRGIVTPIEMAYTNMRKGFDMVRVMWGGYYRASGEDKQPHPTQKPISVYQPFIDSWTKPGDVLADYFCGSAPVIIAAENLSRQCRAVELSPDYCAVALERYAATFGIEAELVG